jgi:hypothetical protein
MGNKKKFDDEKGMRKERKRKRQMQTCTCKPDESEEEGNNKYHKECEKGRWK